ncbi:MAG: hypothetical protein ACR2RV_19970 [Verrucomicrobiales bacterium]
MQNQGSYKIFLAMWCAAFLVFGMKPIINKTFHPLRVFFTGEQMTLPIADVKRVGGTKRPRLRQLVLPVSQTSAISCYTTYEFPVFEPGDGPLSHEFRVRYDSSLAMVPEEPGWAFGVINIFLPKLNKILLVAGAVLSILVWYPFIIGKSHRERRRHRMGDHHRRHRRTLGSKLPIWWIRGVCVLFLLLSVLSIWWAVAGLLPQGYPIPAIAFILLALIQAPILVGTLLNKPRARTPMLFLPWLWMLLVPIGTILGLVTLAALQSHAAVADQPLL